MRWALCKKLQALSILVFSETGASYHVTLKGHISCFYNPYIVCLVTHLSLVTVSRTGQVAFKLWFDVKMAGKSLSVSIHIKRYCQWIGIRSIFISFASENLWIEIYSAKGGKPTGTHWIWIIEIFCHGWSLPVQYTV